MVSPMHSLGESRTQPRTPCSASGECGGKRSTLVMWEGEDFRRGARADSAGGLATSEMELVMGEREKDFGYEVEGKLFKVIRLLFTSARGEWRAAVMK